MRIWNTDGRAESDTRYWSWLKRYRYGVKNTGGHLNYWRAWLAWKLDR